MEQSSQAVDGPLERGVRGRSSQRAAFEAWWCTAYNARALLEQADGCYLNRSAGMAWDAWQAARPKPQAIGAAMNVASMLAQRKPLAAFAELDKARQVGRCQLAKAYSRADEDTRLLAVKLIGALRAL